MQTTKKTNHKSLQQKPNKQTSKQTNKQANKQAITQITAVGDWFPKMLLWAGLSKTQHLKPLWWLHTQVNGEEQWSTMFQGTCLTVVVQITSGTPYVTLNKVPITLDLTCSNIYKVSWQSYPYNDMQWYLLYHLQNKNPWQLLFDGSLNPWSSHCNHSGRQSGRQGGRRGMSGPRGGRHGCRVSQEWGVGVRNVPAKEAAVPTRNDRRERLLQTVCQVITSGLSFKQSVAIGEMKLFFSMIVFRNLLGWYRSQHFSWWLADFFTNEASGNDIRIVEPECSMYGIFNYIYYINSSHSNVGKYTIHGAFGQ